MTTEPGRERGRALRTAVALGLALAGSCSCGATRELTPVVQAGEARTMSIADIRTRLWRRPEVRLVPPSDAERDALEQLVTEASSLAEHGRDTLGVLGPRLAASGFVAELVQVGPTRAIALLDPADRGAGAYFFRVRLRPQDEGPRRLLQAPHAFHDVGTGPLAARMFFSHGSGDAFFTNTLHRYWSAGGTRVERPNAPADVCQQTGSFFHAATGAYLAAGPARIVQLHGFADREELDADAVLSRGDATTSGSSVQRLFVALGARGLSVRRFPEDIAELGATTNEQGRLARTAGADFIHLETSRSLRRRLGEDRALRRVLADALWSTE